MRIGLREQGRGRYDGENRVNDTQAPPGYFNYEKVLGGVNLSVWPLPSSDYTVTITGLFALSSVTMNTDLSLTYDDFFIVFLKLLVIRRLAAKYKRKLDQTYKDMLVEAKEAIENSFNEPDFTSTPLSLVDGGTTIDSTEAQIYWTYSGGY